MKKILVAMVLVWGVTAIAQTPLPSPSPSDIGVAVEVVKSLEPPVWLEKVVSYGMAVPVIGPILVEIMKWLGMLAAVLTISATAFTGICRSISAAAKAAKLLELAEKVDKLHEMVSPWLRFLSMYNVQKEELKKPA